MKKIVKIVLTGGPGSGKSDAADCMKKKLKFDDNNSVYFLDGYRLLFVTETASELISGGVAPFTTKTVKQFQSLLFNLQIAKEKAFDEGIRAMDGEKFVIIYDRGLMDGGAYLTDGEFDDLIDEKGMSRDRIKARYDAVIALESREEYYTRSNNESRTESSVEAKLTAERTLSIWKDHPRFYFIKAENKFEAKVDRVIDTVKQVLSEL